MVLKLRGEKRISGLFKGSGPPVAIAETEAVADLYCTCV